MYKVSVKRYGFKKWDGHQPIRVVTRQSVPDMSDEMVAKIAKDNIDFMSTIKTLVSTGHLKSTDEQAAAGLGWTTVFLIGDATEANAVKDYFAIVSQKRLDELVPNGGLLNEVTIEEV